MKIRTWKFKLGPFTWTRRKIKPTRPARVPIGVDSQTWPAPGWYWAPSGYVFWNGYRWTVDVHGREVF